MQTTKFSLNKLDKVFCCSYFVVLNNPAQIHKKLKLRINFKKAIKGQTQKTIIQRKVFFKRKKPFFLMEKAEIFKSLHKDK